MKNKRKILPGSLELGVGCKLEQTAFSALMLYPYEEQCKYMHYIDISMSVSQIPKSALTPHTIRLDSFTQTVCQVNKVAIY